MTAQVPERIIIDATPHVLYAQPLYRLFASRRCRFPRESYTTACHRAYLGTWEVIDGDLYLVHLCACPNAEVPLSPEDRRWFLRLVPTDRFPIRADWFSGRLKVQLGRMLVYSHNGFSSWYEKARIITVHRGRVVRDRVVDTEAILERHKRRDAHFAALMNGDCSGYLIPPMYWPVTEDDRADDDSDWWPPDYRRTAA